MPLISTEKSMCLTPLSPQLHFMQKPVIWFAGQIKWPVSIWNATLGWNGLISAYEPGNMVYAMLCVICYHLHDIKNMKITHGEVLLLVILQALSCNFTKSNTPPWVFFTFFICTNGTKSRNESHIFLACDNSMQQLLFSKNVKIGLYF